ncbi:MAG: LysR family transcriptional regulator [Pseudomonadota bacterium]
MNIEHLKLFIRIESTQNISRAGSELGLSPAVASAHISKLEENLGVRLVHRTTRKVALTEEGRAFLPHAEEVLSSVEAARAAVGVGSASPSGRLRITLPASFGRMHVLPALKQFLAGYPQLRLDIRFSDTVVDMVEGGFDVAIRIGELEDSGLIARKLAPDRRILCASPDYLREHGVPQKPADLKHHQCITLVQMETWFFRSGDSEQRIRVNGHIRTDSGDAVRDACVAGLGITINSRWSAYQALDGGQLVEVLPDYPLVSNSAIWAVFPSSRLIAPKVRAFVDYFSARFKGAPYWES